MVSLAECLYRWCRALKELDTQDGVTIPTCSVIVHRAGLSSHRSASLFQMVFILLFSSLRVSSPVDLFPVTPLHCTQCVVSLAVISILYVNPSGVRPSSAKRSGTLATIDHVPLQIRTWASLRARMGRSSSPPQLLHCLSGIE